MHEVAIPTIFKQYVLVMKHRLALRGMSEDNDSPYNSGSSSSNTIGYQDSRSG